MMSFKQFLEFKTYRTYGITQGYEQDLLNKQRKESTPVTIHVSKDFSLDDMIGTAKEANAKAFDRHAPKYAWLARQKVSKKAEIEKNAKWKKYADDQISAWEKDMDYVPPVKFVVA